MFTTAPDGPKDLASSRHETAFDPRSEPGNCIPRRAKGKSSPRPIIGVAEKARGPRKGVGECRTGEAHISSSMRTPDKPAPLKSVFAGAASPPGWRIPPVECPARLTVSLPMRSAQTMLAPPARRVPVTPTSLPRCNPKQKCPALTIACGRHESAARCYREAEGRLQTGPIPSADYRVGLASSLRMPLFPGSG
jgi:hypothetical protein